MESRRILQIEQLEMMGVWISSLVGGRRASHVVQGQPALGMGVRLVLKIFIALQKN